MLLAATLIVSGFVKAVDPMGMYYKLNAYFLYWGMDFGDGSVLVDGLVVCIATVEFILGIYLLLGIRRRFTTTAILLFMAAMTLLTAYIYAFNPVADCGCFGDAIVLSNGATLLKNVVLLLAAGVVFRKRRLLFRLISERNQWITSLYAWGYAIALTLYSFHYLPLLEFTPFKEGLDLRKAYNEPQEDTPVALLNFGLEGEDGALTDSILQNPKATFLLTLPNLAAADDGNNDRINDIYDVCRDSAYAFYGVTSFTADSADISRWKDRTGALYPILRADIDQVRSMVRANPGLLLLTDGKIVKKWSHNDLPRLEGQGKWVAEEKAFLTGWSVLKLIFWFVVPLLLVMLVDGLWIGSKFYKHHIFKKHLKQQENEKENRSR